VARAKAGKCYYPIQDINGVWRNYLYYETGNYVPPSAHTTYQLMEMEGTMKGKPVDEEEFPGVTWAPGPRTGEYTWL
jgi:hypothetical protein